MVISSWNLALKARWTCTAYLEPNVDAPKELLLVSQTCESDGCSVFAQIKCGARVHAGASVRLNLEGNDAQSTMETNHPPAAPPKKMGWSFVVAPPPSEQSSHYSYGARSSRVLTRRLVGSFSQFVSVRRWVKKNVKASLREGKNETDRRFATLETLLRSGTQLVRLKK